MKLFVFTVLDNAVGAYLPPFYARSRGEAIRSFTEAANAPDHNFKKNSRDYVLYELGSFDDVSGMFDTGEPDRVLAAAECFIDASPGGRDIPTQ